MYWYLWGLVHYSVVLSGPAPHPLGCVATDPGVYSYKKKQTNETERAHGRHGNHTHTSHADARVDRASQLAARLVGVWLVGGLVVVGLARQ